jgi:hypothetical protein
VLDFFWVAVPIGAAIFLFIDRKIGGTIVLYTVVIKMFGII